MKTILIKLMLLIGLTPLSAIAQQTIEQDMLLNNLVGNWTLQVTIAGLQTTHDITAAWVLDHQYVQLKEVSHEKDNSGKPLYEAIVYICWEQNRNQYSCLWLDNTGNGGLSAEAVGHANANADTIALLFTGTDGSIFHTTFVYSKATDTWQWMMDGEENGKLQPFARVTLTKN